MVSSLDEAAHSLLGNDVEKSFSGGVNGGAGWLCLSCCSRILFFNKHGRLRFLAKLFVGLLIATAYTIIVIFIFQYVNTPWFGSNLLNGTYACHDTVTCALRYQEATISNTTLLENLSNGNTTTRNNTFFSSLYSEDYLPGALTLGYTIRKHHPNHEMHLIYFPEKISYLAKCQLRAVGWKLRVVDRLAPPWEGVSEHFRDQFTKLQMWKFSEFDGIVYIDSDALVVHPLDHVFNLIYDATVTGFEYAAAPDVFDGIVNVNFNAGFMAFRPSKIVFDEIMRTYKIRGNYNIDFAEQAFLNEYYRFRALSLPITFNFNLSILRRHPLLWKMLYDEIKVVHYTSMKPFLEAKPASVFREPYDIWFQENSEMNRLHSFDTIKATCSPDV